jgi:hypothetical protein
MMITLIFAAAEATHGQALHSMDILALIRNGLSIASIFAGLFFVLAGTLRGRRPVIGPATPLSDGRKELTPKSTKARVAHARLQPACHFAQRSMPRAKVCAFRFVEISCALDLIQ